LVGLILPKHLLQFTGQPMAVQAGLQFGLWQEVFLTDLKCFHRRYGIFIGDPTGNGQHINSDILKDGGATWLLSPTSPLATN